MLLYALIPSLLIGLITNDLALIDSSKAYHIWMLLIPITTFAAFIWDGIFVGATASTAMRNSMLIAVLLVFFPAWLLLNNVWETMACGLPFTCLC